MCKESNPVKSPDMKNLARAVTDAAQRFYENPENLARFEAWKKQRKA